MGGVLSPVFCSIFCEITFINVFLSKPYNGFIQEKKDKKKKNPATVDGRVFET